MNLRNLFKAFVALVLCVVVFSACDTGSGSGLTDKQTQEVYLFGNCTKVGMHGSVMGIADNKSHTYSAASLLSMVDLTDHGKYILGVRAYIGDEVTNSSVWVGEDYENPTYEQEFTYQKGGWQYVKFDEPIKINSSMPDVYIGYTITTRSASVLGAEGASKSHKTEWICIDGTWQLLSKAAGNALWSIQAIVTGGDYSGERQHDLVVESVVLPKSVTIGENVDIACEIRSAGIKPTQEVEVECTFGGSSVKAVVPAGLMNGQSAVVTFPTITSPRTGGNANIVINATEFNTIDDKTSDNKVSKKIRVYAETAERNCVLIEQFTGQDCPNCPGGAKTMAASIEGMKNPEKAVWVAHHTYYTDQFSLDESKVIANALNANFAPACNLNRVPRDYGMGTEELIWHPGYSTTKILETALNEPGLATLEMSRTYDAEKRELSIVVKGCSYEKESYITTIVTQSGILARQSGATGDYTHNNAPRAFLTAAKGDQLELDAEGNYSVTYTYTIPDKVGTFDCLPENMAVVAFVHGKISDADSRLVFNADQVTVVPEVDAAVMRAMALYSNEINVDVTNVQLKPWSEQVSY